MPDFSRQHAALVKARESLFSCSNVIATGIGYKTREGQRTESLSLVCSVTRKLPLSQLAARDRIPAFLDDVPTDVRETGTIRAFQRRTERHRPAPGGVSIGHRDITAGTLGCLVRKDNQLFVLSNNHVLADSNNASRGDPILQPGPIDGGTFPTDHIADLAEYVPIEFQDEPSDSTFARGVIALLNAGCRVIGSRTRYRIIRTPLQDNLVDAAIAEPLDLGAVSPEILEIGAIEELGRGELGTAIKKSGRTTGLTTGEIEQVDVTVDVQYGGGRSARFTDQLLAGAVSRGGDSGAAVLDDNNQLLGLLFAGSDNSTIINRIEHVFAALDLNL